MGSVYGRLSSSVGTLRSRLFLFSCTPALAAAITCSPQMLPRGGLPRNMGWHFHHGRRYDRRHLLTQFGARGTAEGGHGVRQARLLQQAIDRHDAGGGGRLLRNEGMERFRPGYSSYRSLSGVQRARQLIDEGFLGSLVSLRAVNQHSGSFDPSAPLKWKLRASEGGRVLLDLGSYLLDLVDWLAAPMVEIRAETRILYPTPPTAKAA